MPFQHEPGAMTRRELLLQAGLAAGLCMLPEAMGAAQPAAKHGPWGPFRVGVQSYSLRGYKLEEALARTQNDFQLQWWEGWPGHMPITADPAQIAKYKDLLTAHNIRMPTFGAVDFGADEADARSKFEFAKAMGIRTITADPAPEAFPILDKLCGEYKINIGIHNHGPGSRYETFQQVVDAIKGHNERIGACVDTGHYLRSDVSPVSAVVVLNKRVYGLHLKDVKQLPDHTKVFTELGKGLLDIVSLLKALMNADYPSRGILSLEYEEHEENPIPYMQECFAGLKNAIHTATQITLVPK